MDGKKVPDLAINPQNNIAHKQQSIFMINSKYVGKFQEFRPRVQSKNNDSLVQLPLSTI